MDSLTVQLVRHADGSVDVDGSTASFEAALSDFVAQSETEQSTIAATVNAQFDKHPGTAIKLPNLASMTCAALNAQPVNYTRLEGLALSYVRANASEKREDGKLFRIGRGKGSGVRRWSEIPTEAPASK